MQHAAAHQQAVLHQGVAVDGISPLLFGIKYGLNIIIYIYLFIYFLLYKYELEVHPA